MRRSHRLLFALAFAILLAVALLQFGLATADNVRAEPPPPGAVSHGFGALTPPPCPPKAKPDVPVILGPFNGAQLLGPTVLLVWDSANCATYYNVVVWIIRTNGKARVVSRGKNLKDTQFQTKPLFPTYTYYWQVIARNRYGRTKSDVYSFTVTQ